MNLARKTLVILAVLALCPLLATAQADSKSKLKSDKSDKSAATSRLRIEVNGGEKSQPVESASVYVKFVEARTLTKDKKFELNVKTNRDGVVKVPEVPRGRILIQVVAEGWKPFGRWYDLDQEEETIKIHLDKPPRWY